MKVFAHGCNINFQESVREMVISDWKRLLDKMLDQQEKTLLGKSILKQKKSGFTAAWKALIMMRKGTGARFLSNAWMNRSKRKRTGSWKMCI